jgi:site-specific recombinase XerD
MKTKAVSAPTQAGSARKDAPGSFRPLTESFRRSLLAENKASRTVKTYLEALRLFGEFLEAQGMPIALHAIRREHVEAFFADLFARGQKPATALNRFGSLRAFFKWAVEEGEIKDSPMRNMKPPHVPEEPPAVLTEEQLKKLLKECEGPNFEDKRDLAIIRLLIDTGMRRAEISSLSVEDVNLETNVAVVMGKGRRPRACPFGRKTAKALDRYLRVRAAHRDADLPNFWLGKYGPMTDSGIFQVASDRAKAVGIEGVFLHQFRHTFAHSYLADGGNEGDLCMLAGWRSRQMLGRYGASAAAERAREAYKKHSPGDKL